MTGYMYILRCADGTYSTGSTVDLAKRICEHKHGVGPHYTRDRLPVELVYFEVFDRIDLTFFREKQIQGWNRKKKEALIHKRKRDLPRLSKTTRSLENQTRRSRIITNPDMH